MVVDHLASPAVAGFSVSKIRGQGPAWPAGSRAPQSWPASATRLTGRSCSRTPNWRSGSSRRRPPASRRWDSEPVYAVTDLVLAADPRRPARRGHPEHGTWRFQPALDWRGHLRRRPVQVRRRHAPRTSPPWATRPQSRHRVASATNIAAAFAPRWPTPQSRPATADMTARSTTPRPCPRPSPRSRRASHPTAAQGDFPESEQAREHACRLLRGRLRPVGHHDRQRPRQTGDPADVLDQERGEIARRDPPCQLRR